MYNYLYSSARVAQYCCTPFQQKHAQQRDIAARRGLQDFAAAESFIGREPFQSAREERQET